MSSTLEGGGRPSPRARAGLAALAALLSLWGAAARAAPGACVGDCNGDDAVTVDELITGVRIAEGGQALSACGRFDVSASGAVEIDELVRGVEAALVGCAPLAGDPAARRVLSLDGTWELGEGRLDDVPPARFDRTVPVPGFVDLAVPPYGEVGVPSPQREAFWYRRTFTAPVDAPYARVRFRRSANGLTAWLNGERLGAYAGGFAMAEFDAGAALRRGAENTLLVRVGADRGRIPDTVPAGTDLEKRFWYPGLWDDVELVVSGTPRIVRVRVEADLTAGAALIETTLRNETDAPVRVDVRQRVREWRSDRPASATAADSVLLAADAEAIVAQRVPLDAPHRWSPDDPFLYVARTEVYDGTAAVDALDTRFGMRTVEWRGGPAGGFFLNGERFYLRGSNLSLHRFFEDPQRGALPWDRQWVRRLLRDHPRALHWNAMRVSIGRLPEFWYDIADEEGLLLADEFMMWFALPTWSADALSDEFTAWIQDAWNHPSIAWWDAANETASPLPGDAIAQVRGLDPTRQWENGGYNPPQGPADPIEDHPYLFLEPGFTLAGLADEDGQPPRGVNTAVAPGHPYIVNEYAWLWLTRAGAPTPLTAAIYERLLGPGPHDAAVYREARAYLTAALTEFWRSHRGYAGVEHFTYLSGSTFTNDDFLDVTTLTLEPRWARYAADAFAPVAVSIDAWADAYPADADVELPVIAWNDLASARPVSIRLLAVLPDGTVAARSATAAVTLAPFARERLSLTLHLPAATPFVLFAELREVGAATSVWSRRKVGYPHPGAAIPDPPFE